MNINTFDLNLLRAFDAVMSEGSITAAAARLGMTQPAMSRTIHRLRQQYNDALFVRTSRGMRPTEYAQSLAEPVSNAIAAVRRALELQTAFDPAVSTRTFRLVMTDVGAVFYLPRLIPHLKRAAPGVTIHSLQMPREKYPEALEIGLAELALGQMPGTQRNLHTQHLCNDQLVCVARKHHPVIRDSLSMAQFMEAEHITIAAPSLTESVVRRALGKRAAKRRIALDLPHYLAVPMIVSACDMIAVMPRGAATAFASKWPLKLLPLPFRAPALQFSQFWHGRSHHDAGHQWLRGIVADLFMDASSGKSGDRSEPLVPQSRRSR